MSISVPAGFFSSSSDDQEAAERRKQIRDTLLKEGEVKVNRNGMVSQPTSGNSSQPTIIIPPGKLASFYWYECNPELLESEKIAMAKFFPQFTLDRLNDGRLVWHGKFSVDNLRPRGEWYLQAVYDHNHPHNNSFGGSVRIYSIEPDLEGITQQLGQSIPHTLRDPANHLYICTARAEDVQTGKLIVTSATSALSWAAKWIAAFELWMAGDLSTDEFSGHRI